MSNELICKNCGRAIVLSPHKYYCTSNGLKFCCVECADSFNEKADDDPEKKPIGMLYDLGLEGD